jgi:hypothetical protein
MKNIHPALKLGLWVVVFTELVKACMVSTYFLKSLPLLVLKYTYLAGEGVQCVDVLPEEVATLCCKVYSLSW